MDIERTALPGIGMSHTATTRRHQRVGVIRHVDGRRDLVLYDPADPERVEVALALEPAEAQWLADLLADV